MAMHRLPAPSRPPGLAGRVFLDSERRLRLGWRLLSYLALVMVATGGVAAMLAGSDPPLGRNLLAHLVAVALVVAITWLFRRGVDRRGWRDLGLPPPARAQLAASGAGFALGVLTIVGFFGVVGALGWVHVDGGEVAERGVAGLIFAALHLPGEDFSSLPLTLVLVADLTLMACFLTLTRLATGSLWLAIGFHTAWNWTMDYVFSLDTAAGPDYGNALVHTRVGGPDLFGGRYGGVELLYALTSALLLTAYWLVTRRRRVAGPREHGHQLDTSTP
jgi:CAAX prenyl protease-like protein